MGRGEGCCWTLSLRLSRRRNWGGIHWVRGMTGGADANVPYPPHHTYLALPYPPAPQPAPHHALPLAPLTPDRPAGAGTGRLHLTREERRRISISGGITPQDATGSCRGCKWRCGRGCRRGVTPRQRCHCRCRSRGRPPRPRFCICRPRDSHRGGGARGGGAVRGRGGV